jgi:peptide/nickel transport system substrate-binding protein
VTHDTTKRRRLGAVTKVSAVLVALALTGAACGGGADDSDADSAPASSANENPKPTGKPVEGGTITVGLEAETNDWLPGTANLSAAGFNVMYALYDSLTTRNPDGEAVPFLAESFESNEDFTAWTFKLRDGVTFHDGSELTAEVIKQNVAVLQQPTSNVANVLGQVSSVDVVDPLTVRYNLVGPNATFPVQLSAAAGMPFSMKHYEALGEDAGAQPVGTGPFVFESWQRDSQLVAVKNPEYWGTELDLGPYLDKIEFRPIPDEDTRLQSVQSGDVDAMQTLNTNIIRQAREDDGLSRFTQIGNIGASTILNTVVPPTDDVRVRRALATAMDQDQLIEAFGGKGFSPTKTQIYGEDSPFHSQAAADEYPAFDPAAAKELLQEYVDDPQRSDGKSTGEPVEIALQAPPDPGTQQIAQAIQAFWGSIGVKADLNSIDQATLIQTVAGAPTSQPPFAGDYQASLWRSGYELDPSSMFKLEFGAPAANPLNFTNYTSPVVEEQLTALATADTVEAQQQASEQVALDMAENLPILWLGSQVAMVATQPEVQNLNDWKTPDGERGLGAGLYGGGVGLWGQAWLAE